MTGQVRLLGLEFGKGPFHQDPKRLKMRRLLPYFLAITLLLPSLAQTGPELVEQAQAAEQSGEFHQARALWSRAADTLAEEGNEAGQALSLFYKAILEYKAEEYEPALATLKESEQIFVKLERDDGISLVLLQQGAILSAENRLTEAEAVYRRSLETARRHGDQERLEEVLKRLAETLDAQHRWNEAYDAYRQLMDHQVAKNHTLAAADTLTTLGAIRQVQTKHEDALEHYRSALKIFQDHDRPAEAAEVIDRISRLLLSRFDWPGAEENLKFALEFHLAHNDREREAIARANLGYAYENQDKFDLAAEQYEASAALFTALDNPAQVQKIRHQQIKALALSGEQAEARQKLEALYGDDPMQAGRLALELGWNEIAENSFEAVLEKTREPGERAGLLNQLGMLAARRSELVEARELFEESLKLAKDTSNDELAASVLNNLGENYQSSGLYREAGPYYRESLDFFRQTGELSGQAYALSNLGTLSFARGDYAEALKYLQEAHRISLNPKTFGGPHALMGTILNALGLVHQFLGHTEDAERLYLEAIAVRRAVNDRRGEIVTLNNLAAMFSERKAPRAATRVYQLALELSERSNDPSHLAQLHNNMGLAAVDLGEREEALAHYEKALALYRAQKIKDGEAITLDNLGCLKTDPNEAASLHQQAVDILEEVGNRQSLATALMHLGESQAKMGQKKEAIVTLTRSVEILEELALALSPNDKSAFLGKNVDAYQVLVRLLVEENRDEEAFRVNERARARALLELLGGRSVTIRKAPPELAQREEALRARIRTLLAAPATLENRSNLASLKQDYGILLDDIARIEPGSVGIGVSEIPSVDALSKSLGPKRALLEYVVQENKTYLFVITAGEITAFPIDLGEDDILKLIGEWRRSFPRGGDDKLAQTLGRHLLEPALEKLGGVEEIVVVPHQNLHYLPFSAVQLSEKALIERYRITRAPSAGAWLLSQKQELRRGPFAAAALGNVSLEAAEGGETARGTSFAALPGTLDEISAVVELFPDSTQIVEEELTSARLREAGTSSGALHVATHGVLDPDFPLFSGLVTSDGLVTVADILEWERTPDLVVLSACETALGKVGDGDDIVGLSRAFQAGGTRCLVATLWPVSDESTSLWMTSFYNALKKEQTTAQASAAATLALRERYPSPYHWAPFVVIGDGETRVEFD